MGWRLSLIVGWGKGLGLTNGVVFFSHHSHLLFSYITAIKFLRVLLFIVTFLLDFFFLRKMEIGVGIGVRQRRRE